MGRRALVCFFWGLSISVSALAQEQAANSTEVAATKEEEAAAEPEGIYFHYALFFAPTPDGEVMDRALKVFHAGFDKFFTYRAGVVKFVKGQYVEFREVDPNTTYAPPEEVYLENKGFGLNADLRRVVQESSTVLVLDFFIVQPTNYQYLSVANQLALAVAQTTGGLIWDEETLELYSPEAWKGKRLAEAHVAFANTSMHGYQLPSQNYRSVTFGLRKLGLPDLGVAEFPRAFWDPVSEMMRFLVTQIGTEGPLRPKTRWTAEELEKILGRDGLGDRPLELIPAPRDEGDPRNDLLTVDFREFPGESYQEKQLRALSAWFQPEEGRLLKLWEQRERLMELSEEARTALKRKQALVEEGLPEGETLLVKVFVEEEYRWLRLETWRGDTLEGYQVPDITAEGRLTRPGQEKVPVSFEQIFDYLHLKSNGEEEGNATGRLIRRLQAQDDVSIKSASEAE